LVLTFPSEYQTRMKVVDFEQKEKGMNMLRGGTLFIGILFALTAPRVSDAPAPSKGVQK